MSARRIADFLDRRLRDWRPEQLAASELSLRPRYDIYGIDCSWYRNLEVKTLVGFGTASVSLMGLASCHPSGFIRADALPFLKPKGGLRYLLLRVNDWVAVVRQAAARLVEECLQPDRAEEWIECLQLVYRLERCGRAHHFQLIEKVERFLRQPACYGALELGRAHPDKFIRRSCYSLSEPYPGLLEKGLKSGDPLLWSWSLREAKSRLARVEWKDFLVKALGHKAYQVRRQALTDLLTFGPEQAEKSLREALLDSSHSVRHLARYYLKKWNLESDFVNFYRDRLEQTPVAILGFGESGGRGEELLPFLERESPRARAAVLEALGHLDPRRFQAQLLDGLQSSNPPRVQKQACRQLSKAPLPTEKLFNLVRVHQSRSALRLLLSEPSSLQRLENLLRVANLEGEVSGIALQRLRQSLDRKQLGSYTPPPELQARLLPLAQAVVDRLSEQQARELLSFL